MPGLISVYRGPVDDNIDGQGRGIRRRRARDLLRESDSYPFPRDECDAPGEILSLDSARIVDRITGPLARSGELRT